MAEIRLEQVGKVYDGDVRAVDDVSLTIESGEFMVLVGPSGCGKSTLLRMIAGLEEVTEGDIWIGEREVARLAPRDRDIAMVFQNYALYPHMTVAKNLGYGLKVRKTPKAEIERRVVEVARLLGLRGPAPAPARRALRRPAPARRDGARDRARAAGVPDGRAALEPGREAPRRHARRAGAAARPARDHDRLRHPRPGRGDDARLPRRGDARRHRAAGRHAADPLPRAGQPLRRRLHRLAVDEPRRGRRSWATRSSSPASGSRSTADRRPAGVQSGSVILGIRPQDFEDARTADPALPRIEVDAMVVEELGSATHVLFTVEAPPVDVDSVRAATDDGERATLIATDRRALFTAEVEEEANVRPGDRLGLAARSSAAALLRPGDGRRASAPQPSPIGRRRLDARRGSGDGERRVHDRRAEVLRRAVAEPGPHDPAVGARPEHERARQRQPRLGRRAAVEDLPGRVKTTS